MNGAAQNNTLSSNKMQQSTIVLTVNNHPGVMSHICGLLARRAYNMEAIMCLPIEDTDSSRIWLLLNEEQRLPQVIQQLQKLQDVQLVEQGNVDHQIFSRLEELFTY